jgi:cysteine-rich repeat protein
LFPAILAIVGGTIDWVLGYRQLRKPLAVLSHMAKQWWFTIEQCLYSAMLLPHKAVQMVDAIIRSNYRMLVSNKKLLEWETAQAAESRLSKKRWAIYQQLWYLPMLGLVLAILLPGNSRLYALPWIVGWILAPWITDQISRVKVVKKTALSDKQRTELRGVLSATWGFLEQFVDQAGNWLPPDNVQEYPSEKVAMRISPTNEGLFLVCALIARDFGLIGMEKMVALLEKNVASWNGLYKYRGHWLNWYDTATCSTLPPRYVSTVDSGNLAVCLMTLRTGLEDYLNRPICGEFLTVGIRDSNAWLLAHLERIDRQITSTSDPLSGVSQTVRQLLAEVAKQLPANGNEPLGWLKQGEEACDDFNARDSGGCNADCSTVNDGFTCGVHAEGCKSVTIGEGEGEGEGEAAEGEGEGEAAEGEGEGEGEEASGCASTSSALPAVGLLGLLLRRRRRLQQRV